MLYFFFILSFPLFQIFSNFTFFIYCFLFVFNCNSCFLRKSVVIRKQVQIIETVRATNIYRFSRILYCHMLFNEHLLCVNVLSAVCNSLLNNFAH